MRALLLCALVLAAPMATADDACEPTRTAVHEADAAGAWVEAEERACGDVRTLDVSVQDPDGRTHAEWFDDERGAGVAVYRSPRFFYWADEPRGCTVAFSAFGATELGCPAGAPPSPGLLRQVPR